MHGPASSIQWEDLYVDLPTPAYKEALTAWSWKLEQDYKVYILSAIGDLFLEDHKGHIHWLDTGRGHFKQIARSSGEMLRFLQEFEYLHEWFVHDLVLEFHRMGLELEEGQVYGFKVPPILGGEYQPENFEIVDAKEHLARMSRIHLAVKDLPEGAEVDPKILEL